MQPQLDSLPKSSFDMIKRGNLPSVPIFGLPPQPKPMAQVLPIVPRKPQVLPPSPEELLNKPAKKHHKKHHRKFVGKAKYVMVPGMSEPPSTDYYPNLWLREKCPLGHLDNFVHARYDELEAQMKYLIKNAELHGLIDKFGDLLF